MKKIMLCTILLSTILYAGELFVDYNTGKTGNTGSKTSPFPSLSYAIKKVVPGDTIYILPSNKPILDNVYLNNIKGTAQKPITIDGMNNIFTGARPLNSAQWKMVKPHLYKKKVIAGANIYGRFFMIIDGKANFMGRVKKSRGNHSKAYKKVEELAPGEWTLVVGKKVSDKGVHHQFEVEYFVRLPEGSNSLSDKRVAEPLVTQLDGVCLRGNSQHLVIRNMIMKNFYNDGYNLHGKCHNIAFENIAAVDCGDDGISAHETCTLTLKNGVFIGCSTAICHINHAVATHENIYAEKIIGSEFLFLNDQLNDLKNAYFITDSLGGSFWNLPKDTCKGKLENIYSISNNPKATFLIVGKHKENLNLKDIQLANFKQISKDKEIKKVASKDIEKKIKETKKALFSLFNGNLEKALSN